MQGPKEIGQVSSTTFDADEEVQQILLLAGRTWRVGNIDWRRSIAYVEPFDAPGRVKFVGSGPGMSRMLAEAHRKVLRGSTRGASHWSERAKRALHDLTLPYEFLDESGVSVLVEDDLLHVHTFAGQAINRTLARGLIEAGFKPPITDGLALRVRGPSRLEEALRATIGQWREAGVPEVYIANDDKLLRGLKFYKLLPPALASDALVAREFDWHGAGSVVRETWDWVRDFETEG